MNFVSFFLSHFLGLRARCQHLPPTYGRLWQVWIESRPFTVIFEPPNTFTVTVATQVPAIWGTSTWARSLARIGVACVQSGYGMAWNGNIQEIIRTDPDVCPEPMFFRVKRPEFSTDPHEVVEVFLT